MTDCGAEETSLVPVAATDRMSYAAVRVCPFPGHPHQELQSDYHQRLLFLHQVHLNELVGSNQTKFHPANLKCQPFYYPSGWTAGDIGVRL